MTILAARFRFLERNTRLHSWTIAATCCSIMLSGCNSSDAVSPSDIVISAIDGTHLSASLLQEARANIQGCAFFGVSRNGIIGGISVPLKFVPFDLPPVITKSGRIPARTARTVISLKQTGATFAVSCIVPRTMTDEQFHHAVAVSASSGRWKHTIRHMNGATAARNFTPEIREARYEILGTEGHASPNGTASPLAGPTNRGSDILQPILRHDDTPYTLATEIVTVQMDVDPQWWLYWPLMNLGDFEYLSFGIVQGDADPADADPFAAITDSCHTGDPIIDKPAIQAALKSIWDQSHADLVDQSQRLEVGGWITRSSDGTLGFVPFAAPSMPCGINIPSDTRPENAIATVHTHPWGQGEPALMCEWQQVIIGGRDLGKFPINYTNQPSDADFATAAELGIPGYLIDKDGIGKYDGAQNQTRYGRCAF